MALEAGTIRLSAIERLPGNPKRHNVKSIEASVGRYGFIDRMIVNRRTGHLLSGHGRLKTLTAAKEASLPPPAGVTIDDAGDWTVPVDFVDLSAAEEEGAAVALNRTTMLGGWDDADLAALLQRVKDETGTLLGSGFRDEDLTSLLAKLNKPQTLEELRQRWGVEAGQVWAIPSVTVPGLVHRVATGSSLELADVARLLDGTTADAVITDPPYELKAKDVRAAIDGYAKRAVVLTGLGDQCWTLARHGWRVPFSLAWCHRQPRSTPNFSIPVFYHNTILMMRQHKVPLGWKRPTKQFGSLLVIEETEYDAALHGHGKSVTLFEKLLAGFKWPTWADPFIGTGATLLACERQRKRMLGMEKDPQRLALCLERLKGEGLQPEKVG